MIGTRGKPLSGVRVLDLSALGPGPYAARLLADHGADVVSVESPTVDTNDVERMFGRGKKSIVIDLKAPGAIDLVADLAGNFDVLIESMRPGKMESLGLGPDTLLARYPRLIYLRITCFGQTGPLAQAAGHDINAIAIGGALALCGRDAPEPPPTLLGDFASGSLMGVIGVLLALYEREQSGRGQVIDASMSDGAALLAGALLPMFSKGLWSKQRGTNVLDGGAPFYKTYRCADDKWMAVGAYEPKFFAGLVAVLGLTAEVPLKAQFDSARATEFEALFRTRFLSKPRAEWEVLFDAADVCVSPVVELDELADHPHHHARRSVFQDQSGLHSGIAPRLSRADQTVSDAVPVRGEHGFETLRSAGFSVERIGAAVAAGIVLAAGSVAA